MAAAPGSRASAPSVRPNASWVELSAGYASSISKGMGGTARAGGGVKSGGGRPTPSASSPPRREPPPPPPHAIPSESRRPAILAGGGGIVWFRGSPARGSPHPLDR